MGQGVWIDSEKLCAHRRAARGAQARHADHRLHRPGRVPGGPHRPASRPDRAEAQRLGLEIVGHMRSYCDRDVEGARHELHAHRHAGRGPVRPLRAHRPRALRRHPRRDRPRLLHQRLPRAGVLRHLRLRQDLPWRRPTMRSPTAATSATSSWTATRPTTWRPSRASSAT